MFRSVLITIFLCAPLAVRNARAHGTDELAAATLVLAGHRDSRERLVSGAFRASGTRKFVSPKTDIDTEVEVTLFCAFDFGKGMLRFERTEPPFNPKVKGVTVGGRFLRTPKCVAQCLGSSNVVAISVPGTEPIGLISPFEIRGVGSLNLSELEHGSTFNDAFGTGTGFLSDNKLADITRESEVIYRLGWDLADGHARRTIWFDSNAGYSPIRLEDSSYDDLKRRKHPESVVEVSWRNESGAWVPETFQVEQYLGIARGLDNVSNLTVYSFALVWETVNQEILPEVFDPEKLGDDIPKTMFVVDHRLGAQPIILKRTDRPKEPMLDRREFSRIWIAVVCIPFLAPIVIFAVLRLRHRLP
jgi:hypothetical protein